MGRDGLGTCNTECQWWYKSRGQPIKRVCPYWVPTELQGTENDIPTKWDGSYDITLEGYETRYSTKITVEGFELKELSEC